jgi:glutathione peroxidase
MEVAAYGMDIGYMEIFIYFCDSLIKKKIVMKRIFTGLLLCIFFAGCAFGQAKSFYDFTVKTIDGQEFALSSLKGKKVLVVNVASKCGHTPQYKQLQALYEKYADDSFVIVGFPANNFGGQEPGTNEEIKAFCESTYGVTFPMMAKISVKGEDIDPLYQWLTTKEGNGKEDAEVKWNFQKFLIDADGNWVKTVAHGTAPLSDEIVSWIESK